MHPKPSNRGGKYRKFKPFPEQLYGSVNIPELIYGIHVQLNILQPLIVINKAATGALAPHTGQLAPAGYTIAFPAHPAL